MAQQINLNADIAEGWGAYDIGNDAALIKIIRSANVACGFHAGDPTIMHRFVTLAKENGCSVGAHPGFNDLWGFGRRQIKMRPNELEYMVAYQIGALQAMCRYGDLEVTHLKPHGALNNMAAEDEDYALAIGRAIKTVDRDIIYVALAGSKMEAAARKLGLRSRVRVSPTGSTRTTATSRRAPSPARCSRTRPRPPSRCCAWCAMARSCRATARRSRSKSRRSACTAMSPRRSTSRAKCASGSKRKASGSCRSTR